MQIAAWVSAILFTQRFIERRPAGCVKAIAVCATSAKCTSQKMWSASTFHIDATKRRPPTRRDSTDQFRVERGAACERFGACFHGQNVRDLRRHDRRGSAALDE